MRGGIRVRFAHVWKNRKSCAWKEPERSDIFRIGHFGVLSRGGIEALGDANCSSSWTRFFPGEMGVFGFRAVARGTGFPGGCPAPKIAMGSLLLRCGIRIMISNRIRLTDWSVRLEAATLGRLATIVAWTAKMNNRLMFRPDLNDCILEDRPLMAIANLGIIVLTTSGLSLVTPFPGAEQFDLGYAGEQLVRPDQRGIGERLTAADEHLHHGFRRAFELEAWQPHRASQSGRRAGGWTGWCRRESYGRVGCRHFRRAILK